MKPEKGETVEQVIKDIEELMFQNVDPELKTMDYDTFVEELIRYLKLYR